MTLKEALKQLKALGTAKVRAQNTKSGAGDNQFGVSLGDIRVLAKKIRTDRACRSVATFPFAPIWTDFMVSRQG